MAPITKKQQTGWPKGHARLYQCVGSRLRELRTKKGVTQEALAHAIGMTRTSLTNIESGRQKLLLHTLMDIASALGIEPEVLLKAGKSTKRAMTS